MKNIGFIGTGIMGKSMLRNLKKAGYTMHCYARHPEKVADLKAEGVTVHPTIAECVKACDIMITIVGFPKDVEEVYFGKGAIFESAHEGMYIIDMTTTSPTLSKKLYAQGKKQGLHVMDAPVTGGDTGARNGTLSILVGGDKADYEKMLPVFKGMGTNINYMGAAGNGQHAKMANQIMIAGAMSGVCEGLNYAKAEGLDLETLLKAVSTGAAGSAQLNAFGAKMIQGDFAPGFFLKHFIKDMRIAVEESDAVGLKLNVLKQVLSEYKELSKEGLDSEGTQALYKYYQK
ncbi:MAG: NAD(P)-dependent oxidoreductase [Acidaminococcus sp.]|nr:NAD(P)-dependent oxidoreductase [Acidaminococcus sp.]MCI2100493.1 NAD(P)-dependent oxidoreductase [Acidaminococcus sp.]MCI2114846.1 NAD(P)-dependent oxidoreductase [Acidaminococcus sp.]MCI2116867.1 NAD(P)-dependent oxidoreductase [Acidaminococcus sp.]